MNPCPIIPAPRSYRRCDGFFLLPSGGNVVHLLKKEIDPAILGEESYRLAVTPEAIRLAASTSCGLFRGFQTLKQLVFLAKDGRLPCVVIEDSPRFAVRSFLIDSARHMQSVDEILRMIDGAALLKMNRLHWHVSDDQGFRIESERFPLLNTVGSYRDGDTFGGEIKTGRTGGYYTKDEVRQIVRYAASKYMEVVPEFDMPGHVSAILAAYPELSCRGGPYSVQTGGGIFPDLLCAGKSAVLDWIKSFLEEMLELFPSRVIHIGGDEAPKGQWYTCEDCLRLMRDRGMKNAEELQQYFTMEVCEYLHSKGRRAIVWNDSLKAGALPPQITVQYWLGSKKTTLAHIAGGGSVIASEMGYMYADYPFFMTPLWKTYSYDPFPSHPEAVLGVETTLWTEYIAAEARLHEMAFPRIAAAAEVGWTEKKHKNYPSFVRNMKRLLPLLASMGIHAAPAEDWSGSSPRALREMSVFLKRTADGKTVERQRQNMKEEKRLAQIQGFSE